MNEINEKSKKNEILDAYYELLNKVQDQNMPIHQEIKQKQQEEEIVIKAAKFDTENIVHTFAQLKLTLAQSISFLEKNLSEQYTRLSNLQEAIHIETKNLEEIHEIKKNADTLKALLLAQKEYKAKFENEMQEEKNELEKEIQQKKDQWKHEQEKHLIEAKEKEDILKKSRKREEEEYLYNMNLERKKDNDAYQANKSALEKDLYDRQIEFDEEFTEKMAVVKAQEDEFKILKIKVEQFPNQLDQAIKNTEKSVHEKLEREYNYKTELKAKEVDGQTKLMQQHIISLQEKIKEQELQLKQFNQKFDLASQQVQSIALKALESAGSRMFVTEEKKNQG